MKKIVLMLLLLFTCKTFASECTSVHMQWLAQVHPNLTVKNPTGDERKLSQSYASDCKVWSARPQFTIMAVGWETEMENLKEGDLEVLLFNSMTGALKHRYYKENQLDSDAYYVSGLEIDTALYRLDARNLERLAFGVRIHRSGSSRPNPSSDSTLSLFQIKNTQLQLILDEYPVARDGGEWDMNCAGVFENEKSTLHILPSVHQGYFEIEVKTQQIITRNRMNQKTDECVTSKVIHKNYKNRLRFNQTKYKPTTKVEGVDFVKYFY